MNTQRVKTMIKEETVHSPAALCYCSITKGGLLTKYFVI